jgi:hypothetical protein
MKVLDRVLAKSEGSVNLGKVSYQYQMMRLHVVSNLKYFMNNSNRPLNNTVMMLIFVRLPRVAVERGKGRERKEKTNLL